MISLHETEENEIILEGGGRTAVARQGNTIFRETGPWAPSVHLLLKHLETSGFDGAPRVVGNGFDEQGRETLTFIEGGLVHPGPWSDEALAQIGLMLRRLHETTSTFQPPPDAIWQPWFLRNLGGPNRVIGHGDLAPWNTLTRAGLPHAFIDWEYAGPVDPLVELARVAWLFPQLHDDDVAAMVGLPPLETRVRQLRILVDAYGLNREQRQSFFDRILEVVVCETAEDAIEQKITPSREGPLWGLAWKSRAAAWMLRHRAPIERALI